MAVEHPLSTSEAPSALASNAGAQLQAGATRSFSGTAAAVIVCMSVALAASLGQNIPPATAGTTFCFDSGHYLTTVQMLTVKMQAWLHHSSASALAATYHLDMSRLKEALLLDGPLLTWLGTTIFTLIGHVPTYADRTDFILMETLFQCLTAAGVCLLVAKCTARTAWGALAGCLWGLYPPAIFACDSFLSEVPATALLVLVVLSLSKLLSGDLRRLPPAAWAVTAGCAGAALLSTKPALTIACATIGMVFLLLGRKRAYVNCKTMTVLLASAVLTWAPWLLWSHQATHHWQIGANRVPTFNLAHGSDVIADGWLTVPATANSSRFFESEGAVNVLRTYLREHPFRVLNLWARKPERLFAQPWNDLQKSVIGLHSRPENLIHIALIAGGLSGALAFACFYAELPLVPLFICLSSCLIVVAHLVYIPFETLPRYGYTAMPFFLTMACFGLSMLLQRSKQPGRSFLLPGTVTILIAALVFPADLLPLCFQFLPSAKSAYLAELLAKLLVLAVAASTCLFILRSTGQSGVQRIPGAVAIGLLSILCGAALVAHANDSTNWRQWRVRLRPGVTCARTVKLQSVQPADAVFLLIDADPSIVNAAITINGHDLPPVGSIYSDDKTDQAVQDNLRLLAAVYGVDPEGLRQWRAVLVPRQFLTSAGPDRIEVSCRAGARMAPTIYGAYPSPTGVVSMPSFSYISPSKLFYEHNLETRITDPDLSLPAVGSCQLRQGAVVSTSDLSADSGRQTGAYRIYLAVAKDSSQPTASNARFNGQPVQLF